MPRMHQQLWMVDSSVIVRCQANFSEELYLLCRLVNSQNSCRQLMWLMLYSCLHAQSGLHLCSEGDFAHINELIRLMCSVQYCFCNQSFLVPLAGMQAKKVRTDIT